ncbi:MAG: hypothetical protein A49_01080 [Methyloceanibacter sp.]|nr:MAG: hypothetical protein A49_01080 [Methyloceanibacter sp.]
MNDNNNPTLDETADVPGDDYLSPRAGAYFPQRYVTDFFGFLDDHKEDIDVITYADLPWGDDWNFADNYPGERDAWRAQLATGERDPHKAYVLLQYDVDSFPERTMDLLRQPAHLTCPANVMIFNKRIDRRRLKSMGELAYTEYTLDESLMRTLSKQGFVVGYHTNAYEQGLFDTNRALEIFDRDVRQLSERFKIEFFSAHGGVPGPEGENNCNLPFHPDWRHRLRWVHNGHTLHFDGQFSDGGHNSTKRNPINRDFRDFVRTFKPGNRYRILLHPQYYSDNPLPSRRYGGTPWYDDLMEEYASGSGSLWEDVALGYSTLARRTSRRKLFQIRAPWRTDQPHTSVNSTASRSLKRPRVVMLVSNPCTNDTRVIRAAETASMQGFDTVVLALSNEGVTSEERQNGVLYRRLANPRLTAQLEATPARISAKSFSNGTTETLANLSTSDLANILLGLQARPSEILELDAKNAFSPSSLSREIGRRLLIRTVKLVRALRTRVLGGRWLYGPLRPVSETRFISRIFKNEALNLQPSIVHAHDLVTLPAGVAIAEKSGAKLIYDAHELEVHRNTKAGQLSRRIRARLERRHIRRCDAVITVCDSIADHLANEYAIERPCVVMNAPNIEEGYQGDEDLRSSLKLSTDTPLAVYVGRITIGRGIEQCVRALEHLPDYHLALVGPTHAPTVAAAENLAKTLGVFDRLHLVPPLAPSKVISFVKSADLSVVPIQNVCLSYYYCLPNKLLESTLAGLPVVVSNFPELRRFVEIGGSGIVMDETDPNDIARVMREAYERRHQLIPSHEKLARVEEIYGWQKQRDSLEEVYASLELLNADRRPGAIKR